MSNYEPTANPVRPLDFGELWERRNPRVVSDALLKRLVHDAEIEAGEEDGDCVLPLGTFHEGVLAALQELAARRHLDTGTPTVRDIPTEKERTRGLDEP